MRAAVAAVEGDVHGPFGWGGGRGDGEVGFRFDFLGVEGLGFVLPGGAAHLAGVGEGMRRRGSGMRCGVFLGEVVWWACWGLEMEGTGCGEVNAVNESD